MTRVAFDITPFLEPRIAPRAVFESLPARGSRPRFMVPADGGWRAVTWQDFADQIRDVALYLRAVGLVNGDRAVVFAPNSVAWGAAALGIQAAGGVMVPIYPASTADQAAYVALHSEARFLFVDSAAALRRVFASWSEYALVERIVTLDDALDARAVLEALRAADPAKAPAADAVLARITSWSEARAQGANEHAKDPSALDRTMDAVAIDQPGLMLYTSGTTGNPKGVPLTHANVAANGADWLRCNAPLIEEGEVDVLWLPMSHIFGLGELCLGNTLGFTTYLVDPASALAKLPEVRPSVFMSVPAYWEKLAAGACEGQTLAVGPRTRERIAALTGGKLKFCLSGGAGLKREVKEIFHDAGVLIIEGYGLTETSPTLTLNRPDAFRFDTVGKPLPSVEIKLADDGEILAKGPNVFAGYHKDPVATREAFTLDGWFKTGDVGRFTDDGFLQIIDRKKDILVTAGGKNVPPANIEARFKDDPLFAHVVVYGDAKRYLVLGVWLDDAIAKAQLADANTQVLTRPRSGPAVTLAALVQARIERVNLELASYESIKRFRIFEGALTVDAGFLTPSLKVRRKKVYEAFRDRFEALYDNVPAPESAAPRDAAGSKVAP